MCKVHLKKDQEQRNASEKIKEKDTKYWNGNKQGFRVVERRFLIYDRRLLE